MIVKVRGGYDDFPGSQREEGQRNEFRFGTFFCTTTSANTNTNTLACSPPGNFCDSAFDEEPSGNVEQGRFGESFELASVRRQFIRFFEKKL